MARARKTPFKREPRTDLEDIRDDTIAVVLNSGKTFKQVQEDGGPTAQTLSKWLYKDTRFPHLDTIRSALQACDYDFVVLPRQPKMVPPGAKREALVMVEMLRPTTTEKLPVRKRRKFVRGRR